MDKQIPIHLDLAETMEQEARRHHAHGHFQQSAAAAATARTLREINPNGRRPGPGAIRPFKLASLSGLRPPRLKA